MAALMTFEDEQRAYAMRTVGVNKRNVISIDLFSDETNYRFNVIIRTFRAVYNVRCVWEDTFPSDGSVKHNFHFIGYDVEDL